MSEAVSTPKGLSKYGYYHLAMEVAGGDGLKARQYFKLEAREVFLQACYMKERDMIQAQKIKAR